jgi:hypothetical protein
MVDGAVVQSAGMGGEIALFARDHFARLAARGFQSGDLGELKAAARLQRSFAAALLNQADAFHPYDVLASGVLLKSAGWYDAYGEMYCISNCFEFESLQKT